MWSASAVRSSFTRASSASRLEMRAVIAFSGGLDAGRSGVSSRGGWLPSERASRTIGRLGPEGRLVFPGGVMKPQIEYDSFAGHPGRQIRGAFLPLARLPACRAAPWPVVACVGLGLLDRRVRGRQDIDLSG